MKLSVRGVDGNRLLEDLERYSVRLGPQSEKKTNEWYWGRDGVSPGGLSPTDRGTRRVVRVG